ncbi:hypothetical protein [Planktothricoides raciborskii]|uniref:Uncharacterized protein n=1 Tax=Planktothricoides raciborskii GIHE-MW2 TaxID=2792601 RepID=A0AAU8J8F5_9CYAN
MLSIPRSHFTAQRRNGATAQRRNGATAQRRQGAFRAIAIGRCFWGF